jgi:UDP-glucose 4-epimerase
MKNKRVLITGGAGFIGSHLVDQLACQKEKPEAIVVVDNFFLGRMSNLSVALAESPEILRVYREDASDFSAMSSIFERESIDVVFDLAVKPLPYSFINPEGACNTSVRIASLMAEFQRKGAFKTLIHFSSSEAYGNAKYVPMDEGHPLEPTTPYSAGKAAADLLLLSYYKTFGLDLSILRPFNNYGPRQNCTVYAAVIPTTIRRILDGKEPYITGDGSQTRDLLYVSDTADAAIKTYYSTATRGKIINVASGKPKSISEIIHQIADLMNYKGSIVYEKSRPADIMTHCGSIDLARQLIDFKPTVNFEEGLAKTVDWFVNNKGEPE